MKFTKEQQDFIKQCGEHFEILTGGRKHSKTKQVIEDMQQEIDRLNNIINELEKYIEKGINNCKMFPTAEMAYQLILDKLKELKENK